MSAEWEVEWEVDVKYVQDTQQKHTAMACASKLDEIKEQLRVCTCRPAAV